MNTFNSFSVNKPHYIHSSGFSNKTSFSSHPHHTNIKPPLSTVNTCKAVANPEFQPPKQQKKRQPTILEVEKAIGAGSFRDADTDRESKESMSLLDGDALKAFKKNESPAEKQLRGAGEWINQKAERPLRSASRPILLFLLQWILPMWILAFFILMGMIELPFHSPWLDDLVS